MIRYRRSLQEQQIDQSKHIGWLPLSYKLSNLDSDFSILKMATQIPAEMKEEILNKLESDVDVSNAWLTLYGTLAGLDKYVERRHKKEVEERDKRHYNELDALYRTRDGFSYLKNSTSIINDMVEYFYSITCYNIAYEEFDQFEDFAEVECTEGFDTVIQSAEVIIERLTEVIDKCRSFKAASSKFTIKEKIEAKEALSIVECHLTEIKDITDNI